MWQIAHRGYSHKYGDNNMVSFNQALNVGFEMIELDILINCYQDIVIFHDIYVNDKFIYKTKTEVLKSYGIILLEDFFREFAHSDIKIFLDIKGTACIYHNLMKLINSWFANDQLHRIYISSFNRVIMQPFINNISDINLGFTTQNTLSIEELKPLIKNCSFVCLHSTSLMHSTVRYLKKHNIMVFAYTCNNNTILRHMISFDLDGIVTNFPIT